MVNNMQQQLTVTIRLESHNTKWKTTYQLFNPSSKHSTLLWKYRGEQHSTTADSYHDIGITQQAMGDHVAALHSLQEAHIVKLKLCGEEHVAVGHSFHEIGIIQHGMKDNGSTL